MRFLPPLEMRLSSIAPNPVVIQAHPGTIAPSCPFRRDVKGRQAPLAPPLLPATPRLAGPLRLARGEPAVSGH